MNQISQASNEQATIISEVSEGINQISVVTQSNTATAEESAASSEEMSAQAQTLNAMISRFKLKQKGFHTRSVNRTPEYDVVSIADVGVERVSGARKTPNIEQEGMMIQLDDRDFGKY